MENMTIALTIDCEINKIQGISKWGWSRTNNILHRSTDIIKWNPTHPYNTDFHVDMWAWSVFTFFFFFLHNIILRLPCTLMSAHNWPCQVKWNKISVCLFDFWHSAITSTSFTSARSISFGQNYRHIKRLQLQFGYIGVSRVTGTD